MEFAENFPFNSRRVPVLARRMVASSQPLAAQAGLEMLREGGNAADAAVATGAALGVVEPAGSGTPGGDVFALFYDAKTRAVTAVNGSGRAPRALSAELLREAGITTQIAVTSPHAVTVPGAVRAWQDLLDRHGTMPLSRVLAPAIRLAEEGYPVSPGVAGYWHDLSPKLQAHGQGVMIDGRAPRAGEIWTNPKLAAVLREVAEGGPDAYYKGRAAQAIVKCLNSLGSVMTLEDLEAHESTFEDPISTTYRGVRVHECAPNGQGLSALIAMNILDQFDVGSLDPSSPEFFHYAIEAMRLGFTDALWYVTDPAFSPAPVEALLSKEYAQERRALISDDKSLAQSSITGVPHGVPGGSDTVYLSAADDQGNACSFITSTFSGFGTGIVPPELGFALQNRGSGFSLDPSHPNYLVGGKRTYHTIIPAMATTAEGELYASFGVKGGFAQPQGHLQVLSHIVDHGRNPQAALDMPRFCLSPGSSAGRVLLEPEVPIETLRGLASRGHDIVPSTDRFSFGVGQVILRDQSTGTYWGGTDPRADGTVAAY